MTDAKCKQCRRAGEKLFLKGEKCFTPKCIFVKRPYAPGKPIAERKHRSIQTEYGKQLSEKQKVKNMYGLRERQFSNYVKVASQKKEENPTDVLHKELETRLDNMVFRMGFALSRSLARQMVSHGHIVVNGKRVMIPSYQVRIGDIVSVREGSRPKALFAELSAKLVKHDTPNWMKLNAEKLEAEVVGEPALDPGTVPYDLAAVIEYYSR